MPGAERKGKRPNILFVMFDQMAALSLRSYGHPVAKTPHIDRLAGRGTLFENAYCAAPLCSPSRFGMLTGLLPSRFGAYDNGAELPAEIPTFLHHLRSAGYRTCLSGKMDFTGADQLHGFEERLTSDLSPSDFGWVPDWEHPDDVQPWFHTLQSVAEAGACDYSLSLQYDEEACDRGIDWLQQVVGEQAASEKDGRPFLLTVSVMQPHDPYQGPRRLWDLYDPREIDLPVEPRRKAGRRNPVEARMHRLYDRDEILLSPRQMRDARRAYYAMISYCDDLLGRLLHALEIAGVAGETIIIVTSDHGDMLGERGLWYKMVFYERAIRVPLIVAGPGIRKQRIEVPVSQLDLLPTFLDLAGARAERRGLDGVSLWPSLTRGAAPRGEVVGEYCGEGYDAPIAMIRRGRHKFIHGKRLGTELYDLAADAAELRNLALEPASRQMVEALTEEAEGRWDLDGLRERVIASQRRRRLAHAALMRGRITPWDYAPRMDAAAAYYRNYDPDRPDPDRLLRRPVARSRRGGA